MVFPAPLGPTSATSCPGSASKLTPRSASSGTPAYRKYTSRSATRPAVPTVGRSTASGASTMSGFRSRYSNIRSNSASDERSSTETWSSCPIGKYSRVCSVVKATMVPAVIGCPFASSSPEIR